MCLICKSMASCVVVEFNYIGILILPDVLLGVRIQVWFVVCRDCVVKFFFAKFVFFLLGWIHVVPMWIVS